MWLIVEERQCSWILTNCQHQYKGNVVMDNGPCLIAQLVRDISKGNKYLVFHQPSSPIVTLDLYSQGHDLP